MSPKTVVGIFGGIFAAIALLAVGLSTFAIVEPGTLGSPPSDAIVLFDGSGLDAWSHEDGSDASWTVEDGAMVCGRGSIHSKESFGDCQLHIEWSAPEPATGEGCFENQAADMAKAIDGDPGFFH